MKEMIDMVETLLEMYVKSDKYFQLIAQMKMKLYKALLAEGFNEEQAMRIVASSGDLPVNASK